MEFKFFPWERDEKPYFINPEGFEWYIDNDILKYLKKENHNGITINNLYPFFVRKGDDITRVILNADQKIVYEHKSYESVLYHIDALKLNMAFDDKEK